MMVKQKLKVKNVVVSLALVFMVMKELTVPCASFPSQATFFPKYASACTALARLPFMGLEVNGGYITNPPSQIITELNRT
jgi:hypothetical protein